MNLPKEIPPGFENIDRLLKQAKILRTVGLFLLFPALLINLAYPWFEHRQDDWIGLSIGLCFLSMGLTLRGLRLANAAEEEASENLNKAKKELAATQKELEEVLK